MNKVLFTIFTFVFALGILVPTKPAPKIVPISIFVPKIEPKIQDDPLVEAHNKIRQSYDLPSLKQDLELMSYAQIWANNMAATYTMQHQSLSGKAMGENIAEGQQSIEEVMNCWMQSSGHRANILRPTFTTIGTGMAISGNGIKFWCVDFGAE